MIESIASVGAEENASALGAMLASWHKGVHTDEFFASDWTAQLRQLQDGGWTQSAMRSIEERGSIVDALPLFEAWGRNLVPLPFSELCLYEVTGTVSSMGVPVADGSWLVPFPAHLPRTLSGKDQPGNPAADDFAPSKVLGTVSVPQPIGLDTDDQAMLCAALVSEAVGCAAAALDAAVAYSKVRQSRGHPISAYQAVQHLLADMHVELELARSGSLVVVRAGDEAPRVSAELLVRCRDVVAQAIQVFGGVGYTWEAGIHFYLRHILVLQKLVRVSHRARDAHFAGSTS